MLHLVERARIEQHEPKSRPTHSLSHRVRKTVPVAELVLAGVQKIEQRPVNHEGRHRPPGAPGEPQESSARAYGTHVRKRLHGAGRVRSDTQTPQRLSVDEIAPCGVEFFHRATHTAIIGDPSHRCSRFEPETGNP